jgi:hypothetical protein
VHGVRLLVGRRDAGVDGGRQRPRNPGHQLERHLAARADLGLLGQPTEDRRVAGDEPDRASPLASGSDEGLAALGDLEPAGVDDLDAFAAVTEEGVGERAVDDDHVGVGKCLGGAQRQQLRVARTCARERDEAVLLLRA